MLVKTQFPQFGYDYTKHAVRVMDEHGDAVGTIRLPLHLTLDEQLGIRNDKSIVLYLSIESGSAAINIMEGKENLYHTTFSAYMTRKKQGVSQIKYLNKKGKSRAGSRVRLAKSLEFFENINAALTNLFAAHEVERIAINCNTTLVPYLHNAKVPCPFDKNDPRLYKIPMHIPQSNYTGLDKAIKKLMAPTLFYDKKHQQLFEEAGLK